MRTLSTQFVTIVILLLVLLIKSDGDSISSIPNDEVNKNSTTNIKNDGDSISSIPNDEVNKNSTTNIKNDGDSISSIPNEVNKNSTTNIVTEVVEVDQIGPLDCTGRPSICSTGEFPPRSVCCGNRCVDLTSDINNCGFCGVSCLFSNLRCCNRLCVNPYFSPFNCGGCGNACPLGICLLGRCAFTLPPQPPPMWLPETHSPNISKPSV
ncbi:Stigma-specific Stig1 family protein [Trifolium repens]|nr:Stigma-specific Stig1 family protein [Trifolium repens]